MSDKFNIGDHVIRTNGIYSGMEAGDTDVVVSADGGSVDLREFGRGHSPNSLELVKEAVSIFKVGVKIKLECYTGYGDHEEHDGQSATVIEVRKTYIRVAWKDESTSTVSFKEKAKPYIINDELKNNKMDINDIKNLDKDVIKMAKANVLKARKESQTEQAEAVLTELLNVKDAVEDKISGDQEVLNSVNEDIKTFDVK